MPPPLVGEALAFRDVFQQTQIGFIENETSLPRAPLQGELARQRLRGQARQNKTRKHSDTMSLTNRACIAVLFAFCQHPCPLRLLRRHLSQSERLWHPATFPEIPETDKIPETPANSTGIVILIYPTCVCFTRVSRHKFVTFCWRSAQTFGGDLLGNLYKKWLILDRNRRKFRFCVHLDTCMDKAKFGKIMPVQGPGGQAEKSAPRHRMTPFASRTV